MRRIDALYTAHPFYGSRKMTAVLRREGGAVNRKRVRRLMRLMGLQSLAPRPETRRAPPAPPVHPSWLRDTGVKRPNQGWATDITDLRLDRGFADRGAVRDWHRRKVLAWRRSNPVDTEFWIDALQAALRSSGSPEIFNTDQGSQFTRRAFTGVRQAPGIRISLEGKGRASTTSSWSGGGAALSTRRYISTTTRP